MHSLNSGLTILKKARLRELCFYSTECEAFNSEQLNVFVRCLWVGWVSGFSCPCDETTWLHSLDTSGL